MKQKHVTGVIRDSFLEFLDTEDAVVEPVVLRQLKDCTDILPGDYCDQLDIRAGSTYGDAVLAVVDDLFEYTIRLAVEYGNVARSVEQEDVR